MKLSVMLNYAGDVKAMADEVSALEKAGVDCVWVAEAYSFDAISMMGYLAASTERVDTQVLTISPDISYVPEEFANQDKAFWKAK